MKFYHWFFLFLSFFLIAALIYSPSLGGPWQYDDYAQILDNKVLTGRPLPKLLSSIFRFTAHPDGWTGTRDFVRATFLLNWQWWGEKPLGYRWTNLTVHAANAALVSALVFLLLSRSSNLSNLRNLRNLSYLSGLFFLVHPLNSQAVAYVAQRFTSVAALFYLLTIILYLKAIRNRSVAVIYYLLTVISALLAYNSKEIAVTLPVALLLVTLALRTKDEGRRTAFILLVLFFLLALKIPLQTATAASRGEESPAFAKIELGAFALRQKEDLLSRRDYFLTQISVVATYLRLAVLPVNQTLDYDYPVTRNFDPKALALAALHLGLIGAGVVLIFQNSYFRINIFQSANLKSEILNLKSLIGFGLLWFYLTLLPESSIIPIPDVIYEHRAYLPMVGLVVALAGAAGAALSHLRNLSYLRYLGAAAGGALLLLSAATVKRASVWGNEVRLWADVYAKAPQKPRAVKNYGVVLAAAGKYDQGIELLEKAVVLDPDNADYWSNLGTANLRAGRYDPAKDKFLTAYALLAAELGLPPYENLSALSNLSNLSILSNLTPKTQKQAAQYLNDYGVCLVQLGRGEESLAAFQKSLSIDPGLYAARLGLGAAYNLMGETQKAIDVFEAAVEEFPDLPDAYNNLAVMYKKAGRIEDHDRILKAAPKPAKTP